MWVKKLDVEELGIEFMPRAMDPLDQGPNKYDNMVEDEEEFEEKPVGTEFDLGLLEAEILMKANQQ